MILFLCHFKGLQTRLTAYAWLEERGRGTSNISYPIEMTFYSFVVKLTGVYCYK